MTSAHDAEPRQVVVTGGNRGIGYALVRALIRRGDHVTFTARSRQRGTAALSQLSDEHPYGQLRLEICDVTSAESIRGFAQNLLAQQRPIDALVHNAGVLRPPAARQLTRGSG